MSKTFTKCISRLLLVLFFILAGHTGFAQYNKSVLETGYYYTGLARNGSGDLFAIRYNNVAGKYRVVRYVGLTGSRQEIPTDLESDNTSYPYGIAVNSRGDIFVTSNVNPGWEVIKLTYPSYTPSKILAGKFISGLAVDKDDNLITLEFDGNSNYIVRKYPAGSEGNNGLGRTLYTGMPLQSTSRYPSGLAVDSRNNIYFTDFLENSGGKITKLRAPWYTSDSSFAIGRAPVALAFDEFDRLHTIETTNAATPEVASIIRYNDSSFTSSTVRYNALNNGLGSYPGGVVPMSTGHILATDGVDQEIVMLTPTTTQIMDIYSSSPNPTAANLINFQVYYSGSVSGVGANAFSLVTTGSITDASIASITAMAEPNRYVVTVNTGSGSNSGTIKLVANAGSISPAVSNAPQESEEVLIDKDPPSGTIVVNGGNIYINTTTVPLTLTASDATSGIGNMSFAIDGGSFSTPEPFATSKNVTIPAVEGSHTISYRVSDRAGNAISMGSTVIYDVTPPAAPTIQSGPATATTSSTATFTFAGEAGATFSTSLDGGGYANAGTPLTFTGIADGTHTLLVTQTDRAGNTSATAASYTWTVDNTPPQITSVSVPANGYYRAGMSLVFKVKYNEVVNVTTAAGTPYINIIIGLDAVQVPYTGGTGTDELTFTYVVQQGEDDNNGISVQPNVQNNSGFIRDAVGNNASTALQNVATTTGVLVNTVIPTVTLSTTANAVINAPYTVTATFSEAVTGLVAADFTVTNATVSNLQTSDNIVYTLTVTPAANGTVTTTLPANTANNIGGNPNTASNTISRTFDITPPIVTSVSVPADGYYRENGSLTFTVRFNENIIVTTSGGTPTLSLTIGSATVNAGYAGTSGTDGIVFSYSVNSGDEDMDGIQVGTISLNGATIRDAATNNATLILNNVGNTANVRVNTTSATVALTTAAGANVNAPFTVTAKFSEAVTGVALTDFNVTNGTAANLQTADNIVYTITVTPAAQGNVTVQVPANAAVNVGNNPTQASNVLTTLYDNVAPTVTAVSVPANGYYNAGTNLDFTVTFSEDITLNTTGGIPYINITIGSSTLQARYNTASTTNGLTFRYTVVNGDQDMNGIEIGALQLNGATIRDAAANNATLTLNGVGATTGVFVNTTHPTVTVSTTASALTNVAPIVATITFSEAVTGLVAADLTVVNGTAANLQTTNNITYTVDITPAADGTVTISVPADAAVNIGNNGNSASNTLTRTYDATAPAVTAVAVPANGYYKAGQALNFVIRLSENITINTTGGSPELNLTIGSTAVKATYTGANGTDGLNFSYTILDGQLDMNGIEIGTLALNGGTIADPAGNNANLTLNNVGNTTLVRVNTTHPTVTISTTAPSLTNAAFTATVTFSEAVTGFTAGDVATTNAAISNVTTTDNITYTMLVTPAADGAVSLNIPADAAVNIGDNGNSASNTLNMTYDGTSPAVTAVTVPADGYYRAGDAMNFTVTFSENIILNTTGGNPTLSLTIGSAAVNATYTGLSGSNGLNFSYTVVDGDQDMDGIQVGTLALNGATIRDAATNNANLTLNGVGNTTDVKVNTQAPVVTLTAAAIVNAPFTVTATFSEAVTGLTASDFAVTNGTAATLQTSNNITYTITVTPAAEGNVTISLPADAAMNIGNNGTLASNTLTVRYDATAPVVSAVSVPANGYYKAGQTLGFTVTFNEDITLNSTGGNPSLGVVIGTSTVQAAYTGTSGTNGLNFSYTVANGDQDMNGIAVGTLTLNGATIRDAATNNANLNLNGVGTTTGVFVNTTHPTVTVSTNAAATTNTTFTATITFSEAVTGFAVTDITVTNATLSSFQTTDNITFNVVVTPTAEGNVTLNVPADVAVNIGDNGNQASNTLSVGYDITAPVVTAVSVPANGYYKAGQQLLFTVTFNENVTLDITGGRPSLGVVIGTSTVQAAYAAAAGSNAYTFSYTVADGDMDMNGIAVGTLSLNGAAIRDAATNNANLTLNNIDPTNNVFVNTTRPTVTVSTAAAARTNAPFTATIIFSEAVTGLTAGDITATNATLSNLTTTDNITYTVLVTPTADGTVTVRVPADAAVNIGDNGNQASNTLSLTYDATAPVVTAVSVPADGYYKAGDVLNFSVKFSEQVTLNTTGGNPYLTLTIGAATVNAVYTGNGGTDELEFAYTVVTGDQDMDGIAVNSLSLNGATLRDAATNNANLALNNIGNTTNVRVNTTSATVTLTAAAAIDNAPFTVTATFSEAVTGLTAADFVVTNGTASGLQTTDNIIYTVTITPATDGAVTIQLPAAAAVNIGNNGTQVSNTLTVTYDATRPVVTSVTVPANGYYKEGDVLNFTVTFNENTVLNTAGGNPYLNVVLGTGTVRASYTTATATSVSFRYVVRPGDMDLDGIALGTLNLNGASLQDAATNDADLTLRNTGNTTGVFVHTGSPSVQLSTTAGSRVNAPFTVSIVFNEAVSGLTADDFTVTNGTAANVATTDNITYTLQVTPAADGTVTIQLPTGKVVNVVNYVNTASNILTLTYDATAPVVDGGLAFQALERSAAGTQVGQVTATDASGIFQNWTIVTDDSNGALAIDADGNLTVNDQAKLNAKANSTITLTVTVSDGLNTSAAVPVTVEVLAVNQAPTLNAINNVTICPDAQPHTVQTTGASAVEPAQTYGFSILTDNPANFDQLSIDAAGLITYQLKASASGASTVIVTIKDNGGVANGGVDTLRRSFTITVATLGQVDITSDKGATVSKGDVVRLTATGGTIFRWNDADGIVSGQQSETLTVRPMENTTYRVTVSNAAGCSNTAEFTLTVVEDFKVDAINILTPNGDGINDKWLIRNLDSYPDNEVKVFDRAGRMVFVQKNYSNNWDGTMNGSPLAEGTYYYILTIEGGAKTAKGYITIVRDRR
ncbi:Ig-like domain-containing protein [Chitinophaga rhizophila]|uniref:Gliding motility-associated C-terminal domain-containing protein n=1 Tax=Chitinophaga rhizophila TaxID=2866212 RepID=A0ABS7GAA0_9BACT|nr:Ig-like domain-containing protein [Chitinophaga rhizophila]MBW8684592.1 gliding motility-associated C-terminal domain-containing protein [Chitinophaga rhizophila]